MQPAKGCDRNDRLRRVWSNLPPVDDSPDDALQVIVLPRMIPAVWHRPATSRGL